MVWADLYTKSPQPEIQFYTSLFGWTSSIAKRPSGATYTILSNQGQPVAGVVLRAAPQGDTGQGHWINYVAVADVDQTLAAATGQGGKIVHPAKHLDQRGTQGILADSQGLSSG